PVAPSCKNSPNKAFDGGHSLSFQPARRTVACFQLLGSVKLNVYEVAAGIILSLSKHWWSVMSRFRTTLKSSSAEPEATHRNSFFRHQLQLLPAS
ncbi:unnamed protein product, partial [Polarella glacialis]